MTTLTTERLLLRPLSTSDAESIVEYISNYEVAKMLGRPPYPYTHSNALEFIEECKKNDPMQSVVFGIVLQEETTKVIGTIGLDYEGEKTAELGYWIGETFWGKGYVSEAVEATINYGFVEMGLTIMTSSYFERNNRSRRILMKNGFKATHSKPIWSNARGCDAPSQHLELSREIWSGVQ